jgi:copper oxidase (laccase) domain-containing protein
MTDNDWIRPQWPAPESVHAVSTTRSHGFSHPPYDELNLGTHVGDDINLVRRNRQYLIDALGLPAEPLWMEQVHGIDVLDEQGTCGDARIVQRGEVAVVMTADCLPVLFCDQDGHQVAAAHAGWRGLEAGVLEHTVDKFKADQTGSWPGWVPR